MAKASGPASPFVAVIEAAADVNGRYERPRALRPGIKDGYFSLMFQAMDIQTGREVALKFFDPTHNGDLYRRQCFSREAQVLSQFLGKDNILQIVEGEQLFNAQLTTAAGVPVPIPLSFFVTELAPASLKDFIYSSHSSARDNLILFREICKGVQRLHSKNTFHRDLKPDNCLVFPGRIAKLCDFGTARSLNDAPLQLNYNLPVGEVRYSALELFAGLGNQPEFFFGSDLFSMGAILFELFTKHILTSLVYDLPILQQIMHLFSNNPSNDKRKQSFDAMLPSIIIKWSLPDLEAVTKDIPRCIASRLNLFYKQLADLDYRCRGRLSFEWIFREIQICLTCLENERAVYNWLKKKTLIQQAALK